MYSPLIQKLIELFSKFPTVGPRTATRFVFYLVHLPEKEIKQLIEGILKLKQKISLCSFCFKTFEKTDENESLCEICQDKTRDKSVLCIVEKEIDLQAIENTKKYNGRYFILGGLISKLKKESIEKLRINELIERAKNPEIKEIIIALNPTPEGEATTLYLERKLKNLNKKITKLARGLPTGGELEYADPDTLTSALEGRK